MQFAHLAQRLFNVPLAITQEKAEIIMTALSERLGITNLSVINPKMGAWSEEEREENNPRRGYDVVEGIAIIQVTGTLVQKLGTLRPWSGMTGYDGIRQNFLTALTDPKVQAIAFDIDSPGGEVSGCFDLVDTIYNARGTKPVWAILDENAYSAAYAIASPADYITVPRTGGTGSVGVIYVHTDMSKAITNAGIKVTFITYGAQKADGNPYIALSDAAKDRMQNSIDTMGDLFVETVARNRGMDRKAVRNTEAGIYLGGKGVEIGFADAIMSPDAAFLKLYQSLQ